MKNKSKMSKKHSFAFITPDNIDQHSKDIETALHLPSNDISVLFSDECINIFKNKLDQSLADCINITKKFSHNSLRFHGAEGEDVAAYFEKSRQDMDALANQTILSLEAKHEEFIRQYTNEISNARTNIKNTKGYNEAILLTDMKKNIILAIQCSPNAPDSHALDNCADNSLDAFHNKIAAIIKASKHHKKQVVHDIKKQLDKISKDHPGVLGKNESLIFHDKHSISFTMAAYMMELTTINAQNTAKEILKAMNAKSEETIRVFEKDVFLQDHLEKLRRSSTQVFSGLTLFRESSRQQNSPGFNQHEYTV